MAIGAHEMKPTRWRIVAACCLLFATLSLTLVDAAACAQPDIHRVFFADAKVGYAIASTSQSALILKTNDGGLVWEQKWAGSTTLTALYFRSPDEGWVIGDKGLILSTRDGGEVWEVLQYGNEQKLTAIAADESGNVLAVGDKSTVLSSANGAWSKVQLPVPTVDLTDLIFLTDKEIFLLGKDRLLASGDGGQTWTTRRSYKWKTLFGLAFFDRNEGFLRSRVLLSTRDGGRTVTPVKLPTTDPIIGIRAHDGDLFVIAGSVETGSVVELPNKALGSRSEILRSSDRGETWKVVHRLRDPASHAAWIADLFFLGGRAWAVGARGTVVHSLDGGTTWQRLYPTIKIQDLH